MNLVLFEDALMHLPGDLGNISGHRLAMDNGQFLDDSPYKRPIQNG
jgi:hypothetical protein